MKDVAITEGEKLKPPPYKNGLGRPKISRNNIVDERENTSRKRSRVRVKMQC